jgi:hypothetical protein
MENAIELLYEEFAKELNDESKSLDNIVFDLNSFNLNETDYDYLDEDINHADDDHNEL